MKYNKFSRRMFLQGSGGLFLSIPFLNSLVPLAARAAEGEPIRRYLTSSAPFHLGHNRNWFPKMTTLANPLAIPGSPHQGSFQTLASLMSGKSQLSPIINSSLNPYLDKMMLYKGLDIPTHGVHASAHYLGSAYELNTETNPKTETIDRFLAKQVKFDAAKRSAIRLGNWGSSYEADAAGNVIIKNPIAWRAIEAYNLIFNNGSYPETGAPAPTHSRRDVLTRVLGDFNRVKNGRQISAADKLILEHAMDNLSDLQNGLTAQISASCLHVGQDPTAANNLGNFRFDDSLNYKNYVNLIKAIFLCDLSRVVAFGNGVHESQDNTAGGDYHGNVSHKMSDTVNGIPNWKYAATLYSGMMSNFVAPMVQALDSCIDPANGKSFLHNGLFHVSFESMYVHRQTNIPTLTFGSINGALPTGYMINYCDPTRPFSFGGGTVNGGESHALDELSAIGNPETDNHSYDYPGIPYQRFLVTLLQGYGLSPSDYETTKYNAHMLNRTDGRFGVQNNGIANIGGWGVASFENVPNLYNESYYHHDGRLKRYNYHYYKFPVPMP